MNSIVACSIHKCEIFAYYIMSTHQTLAREILQKPSRNNHTRQLTRFRHNLIDVFAFVAAPGAGS